MKQYAVMCITWVLTLALLLSSGSVLAVGYDWAAGVPSDWYEDYAKNSDESTITATHVLTPVNPNASQEAKNLFSYMSSLTDTQQAIIGQFDMATDGSSFKAITEEWGLSPALYSARYKVDVSEPKWQMDGDRETAVPAEDNTSMSFTNVATANEQLKAHYDKGAILLVFADSAPRELCSKMAVKNKPTVYEDESNAIVELDATNPDRDMQAYALWMTYQKNMLDSLKALEDSGVKAYLWRPWIEFNYHTFAGIDDVGYQAFVRVYQQTVQMAIDAGLTGFLSTYSPGCWGNTVQRNPGNAYVDVYAATMYSEKEQLGSLHANQYTNYDWYVKTGKPVGFAEFSARSGATGSKQARGSWFSLLEDLVSYWPRASWFCVWDGLLYTVYNDNGGASGNDDGSLLMDSPFTLHLGEIADYRTTATVAPGVAQFFTGATTYVGMEERAYTAADLKAMGLSLSSVCALRLNTGYTVTFYESEDCSGDGYGYGISQTSLPASTAAMFRSCKVSAAPNVALNLETVFASVNDDTAWKANDGFSSVWEADINAATNTADKGTAWLHFDLGNEHTVSRYVVKTAGFAGLLDMYNVRDFQLQSSDDGVTWTTVDTVTGNTASQVNRTINPVTARHFRLLITGANSSQSETDKGLVAIAELELYGLSLGKLSKEEPPAVEATPEEPPILSDEVPADEPADSDEEEIVEDDKSENKPSKKPIKNTYTEVYFPWWAWVLIAVGVLAVAGGIVLVIVLRKKRQASAGQ